jgi:hypothetical protein
MTSKPLYYQTALYVGGLEMMTVEPFDSLHERWLEAMAEISEGGSGKPIEITVSVHHHDAGLEQLPVRASVFSPRAITMMYELPISARRQVQEHEAD